MSHETVMRSPVAWALALSLSANAVIFVAYVRQRGRAEEAHTQLAKVLEGGSKRQNSDDDNSPLLTPEMTLKLKAGDPEALRDFLDACGASRELTRWMVEGLVSYRFHDEKIAAVSRMRGEGWWKGEPDWWKLPERKAITRRENAEVVRLVGGYPRKEASYPWRTEALNFLGADKRDAFRKLEADYEEMHEQLPPTPWLPREAEISRRLENEKRRDIVALLSVEELAEYDFREDAGYLGRELDKYGVTDAELRAVYQAREERMAASRRVEQKYPGYSTDPFAPIANQDPRGVAEAVAIEAAYDKRVREIFGEERMNRGDREADPAFKSIQAVTQKFGLEKARAERLYDLLSQARDEHLEIGNGADSEVRSAALRQDALEQINQTLPPEAASLLLDQVSVHHYWLRDPKKSP